MLYGCAYGKGNDSGVGRRGRTGPASLSGFTLEILVVAAVPAPRVPALFGPASSGMAPFAMGFVIELIWKVRNYNPGRVQHFDASQNAGSRVATFNNLAFSISTVPILQPPSLLVLKRERDAVYAVTLIDWVGETLTLEYVSESQHMTLELPHEKPSRF